MNRSQFTLNLLRIATIASASMLLVTSWPTYAATLSNTVDDWPDERYVDNGDNTITDTVTGLMWQKCIEGLSGTACESGSAATANWPTALANAESSVLAGCGDWRLPNYKELHSLLALNRFQPSVNETAFPATTSVKLWTSSLRGTSAVADTHILVVNLHSDSNEILDSNASFGQRYRMVRDADKVCI